MVGSRLGIYLDEDGNEQQQPYPIEDGPWDFDEDDMLLIALLQDPIYCAELLCEDPNNREYAGMYTVRDYQYPLNRGAGSNYEGYTCGRTVGKTESIKNRTMTHPFRRIGENLLITAPELIHLLPLTDAIEDRFNSCRLTREFLDTDAGRTGFTHRPFGVDFVDGTKIVGRIPRLTGVGVKGQHQPDLLLDEGQDYPDRGWTEVHEAQPLDARVLTPRGYRTMGDLVAGDMVIGSDGFPTLVRDVLDHGERDIVAVRFSDGAVVECDLDHLWTVQCSRDVDRNIWRVLRTREIAGDLERGRGFGSLKRPWFVPTLECVRFARQSALDVDPYVLGAFLGDGSLTRYAAYLCTVDEEMLEHVGARLDPSEELVGAGNCSFRLRKRGSRSRHEQPPLRAGLERVGAMGCLAQDKYIPPRYLTASAKARLELLRGLIDTDGNVDQHGAVRFTTSSPRLADDVEFLVRSLGGHVRRYKQEDKRGYRTMFVVRFRIPGVVPCRLSRKAERIRHITSHSMRRGIVAIEPAGRKPVRCIEVDAADGLYVTDDFILTHNTVLKDHVDFNGELDFSYVFYGVHSGARDSGFHKRATQGGFKITQITALMRPGWGASEKNAAKAAYGGTSSPDYRRNIYGEPGSASSPLFNAARLMACMDQDRESDYNLHGYRFQEIRAEEFDELGLPIAEVLDLPSGLKRVWVGADLGLTVSPTVIMIFSEERIAGKMRLKLVRRIHLERMRTKQIRHAFYAIATHFGDAFMGLGMDETGLGFPIWQEIEDDELAPAILLQRSRGWFFNSKVPVGIAPEHVARDERGSLSDQYYGGAVTEQIDPMTGERKYIVTMPMIEASTRYLRDWVDKTYFMFPFDPAVIGDMQGDTQQRLKRIVGLKNKPNAFHILDAERVMAMIFKAGEIEEQLATSDVAPVLELAIDDYADVY